MRSEEHTADWSCGVCSSELFYLLLKDSIKSAADEDLGLVRNNVIEMVKSNSSIKINRAGGEKNQEAA